MTDRQLHMSSTPTSPGPAIGVNNSRQLRALIPPMTPKVIFRALLGVLLFFCGIVLGVWFIFRSRRDAQDSSELNA